MFNVSQKLFAIVWENEYYSNELMKNSLMQEDSFLLKLFGIEWPRTDMKQPLNYAEFLA